MNFGAIKKIEPELEKLESEIVEYMNNSPGACWERSQFWYRQLKPRFIRLVGFNSKKPELSNCESYDTAYSAFVEILKI